MQERRQYARLESGSRMDGFWPTLVPVLAGKDISKLPAPLRTLPSHIIPNQHYQWLTSLLEPSKGKSP